MNKSILDFINFHKLIDNIPVRGTSKDKQMGKIYRTVFSGINNFTRLFGMLAQIGLVGLLVIVFFATLFRYLFKSPILFCLEISEYLFVFLTIICAGWILREGSHIQMGLFLERLPKKTQIFINIAHSMLITIFCAILVWKGGHNVLIAYRGDYHSNTLLNFPLWISYSIVPVGALLLGIQYIFKIEENIKMFFSLKISCEEHE
jgi:TRAP-type C4-dicarboxylate transport system permease small subunit